MPRDGVDFLFSAVAGGDPNRVAAVCGAERLSYGQLDARSDRLAARLRAQGVGPESLVVLPAERSVDTLIGLLAAWKAGGAFLPLDLAAPRSWLQSALAEARPQVALATRRTASVLSELGLPVLPLDGDAPRSGPAPRHPEAMAYCTFTSGTTGPPKGVMVADRSIANHCRRLGELLALEAADRVLQATPLTVDASLEEILPTLAAGAAVVIPETPIDPGPAFMRLLDKEGVSVVSLATSIWDRWLEHPDAPGWTLPSRLRLVFVGGERVQAHKLRRWQALPWTAGLPWITDYGPTEGTISCTAWQAPQGFDGDDVPIGRPIGGARVTVLDEALRPPPAHQAGRIWIGGVAPARGYVGRPALTAERFRPDPDGAPGGRLYDSGDLGRLDEAGQLRFLGRRDGQVKIAGIRVETGRVEESLLRRPGVRDAAVAVVDNEAGEPALIGFVTGAADTGELRSALAAELPAAMIPDRILAVPELPRSGAAGKVDHRQLKLLAQAPAPSADATSAGRVRACWTRVMGAPPADDDVGFFAAGGDSLRGLRLLRALREAFGLDIGYARLAALGSVADLAAALDDAAAPIAPGQEDVTAAAASHPPSHGQRRLWFLDRLHPGSAAYSVPLVFEISGAVDIAAIDRALARLVRRHEALRSAFREDQGTPTVEVLSEAPLQTVTRTARDRAAAVAVVRTEMARPFDLAAPPLLRSLMVAMDGERSLWLLNAHHAVVDAWSLDVLIAELSHLLAGEEPPPPSGQMRDHAAREAARLAGGAEAARRFWAGVLDGALPEFDLTHGDPPHPEGASGGGFTPFDLGPDMAGVLRRAAQAQATTPFVLALSAFAATLHRWTLQERLLIGVPSACRGHPGDEGVVGFLTNTLPLVLDIDPAASFTALTRQVALRLAQAITHEDLPLDLILEARGAAGRHGHDGLIRTLFVMQDTPVAQGLRVPGCTVREVALHNGTAKMDLTATLRTDGDALVGGLEYARAAQSPAEAESFAAAFAALLRGAMERPDLALRSLPAQPRAAMVAQADAANRSAADYEVSPALHAGFLARCRAAPDAVALVCDDGDMTYGQLEAASAAAAAALAGAGVYRETLVGLCMPRSAAAVTAMLGVLRAGGAFVPLSPDAPAERNRAIAREAGLRHIIADVDAGGAFAGLPLRVWRIEELTATPGRAPDAAIAPEQLAYCYYTSGSTGRPKGVMIDHRCASSRLEWLLRRYPLGRDEALAHKTPLVFDVAIWEIFAPLHLGATMVIVGSRDEGDPSALARLLDRRGLVAVHFVPSLLDAFLKADVPFRAPGLRWLQVSGEAPGPDLVARVRRRFGHRLHNCYGQTETSEVACWEDDGERLGRRVPIGAQVGIYRLFLVDAALNPVPDGMPGEIAVAGAGGLARGYADNPRLTATRFLPNPFARHAGERLYLTGDIGRRNRKGLIEVVGRVDGQLKLRGCRVEPGEVEQVLLRHPDVLECAVVAARDRAGNAELVAYVVGPRRAGPGLARHAETHLPDYMLPAAYVWLARMPLTATGKLDRAALPPAAPEDYGTEAESEPPREGFETLIAEIWIEVLGRRTLGRSDSFFSVGGNSLSAIQVLSRLRGRFGLGVSVRDFFARPTIGDFAPFLEQELRRAVAQMSEADLSASLVEAGHD